MGRIMTVSRKQVNILLKYVLRYTVVNCTVIRHMSGKC